MQLWIGSVSIGKIAMQDIINDTTDVLCCTISQTHSVAAVNVVNGHDLVYSIGIHE